MARFAAALFVVSLVCLSCMPSRACATQAPAPSSGATPGPAGSAAPAAAPAAPPPIPKNFDPCGGPLELLNKIGNGTACVFVLGEGAVTAQYASANIPVNSQFNFDTPSGGRSFGLSTAAHAFGYPSSVIYAGIAPRAQIAITAPSFAQVNSSSAATLTGSNLLAAGSTDMKFEYKQLVYVNLAKFTMLALDFSYKAPTGSPALRGLGPSYTLDPILTQPLPHNFGVTLALPFDNSASRNGPTCMREKRRILCMPGAIERGTAFTSQLIPYWQSQGGTMLALVVQHNFHPSTTPVVFSAAQLIGRHFMIAAAEGGFNSSTSATGLNGLVNASATAYPSLFTISVNYLFGVSNLPAALQQ